MGIFDNLKNLIGGTGQLQTRRDPSSGEVYSPEVGKSNLLEFYNTYTGVTYRRSEVYRDMDLMDNSLLSRALDMIADDATQLDLTANQVISITSEDPKKERILRNMVDRLGLEESLWSWSREVAKYGDKFLQLVTSGVGISHVNDARRPELICRLEKNGKLVGFLETNPLTRGVMTAGQEFVSKKPFDYVHFRSVRYSIVEDLMPDAFYQKFDIDDNPKYGSPAFINSRAIEKKISLAEDSLVLARLAKSIFYRVHYVDVGQGTDTREQKKIVSNYKKLFVKQSGINYSQDYLSSERNPMSFADEIIVPVYGSTNKGRSEISTFGGDVDVSSIVDIEFLNSQRFGTLGIPKQYLSFDGDSALSYNSLIALDPRYARKVASLQKDLIIGLTIMCQIELYLHGLDIDPTGFKVSLTPVSTNGELDRADALSAVVSVCQSIAQLVVDGAENIDKKYLYSYLIKTYLRLPNLDIDELYPVIQEEKESDGDDGEEKDSDNENSVDSLFASKRSGKRNVLSALDTEKSIDRVMRENRDLMEQIENLRFRLGEGSHASFEKSVSRSLNPHNILTESQFSMNIDDLITLRETFDQDDTELIMEDYDQDDTELIMED
jgi:hypothetical protein